MRPVLQEAPTEVPITIADLRNHARINDDEADELLQGLVDAAVAYLDGWRGILGRCICSQTWSFTFSGWSSMLTVPFPDVSALVVKYYDVDGAEQTLDDSLFVFSASERGADVFFVTSDLPALDDDRPYPVFFEVTAGYGGTAAVPASIKHALLMIAAHWYDNPEGQQVPPGVHSFIAPQRWAAL